MVEREVGNPGFDYQLICMEEKYIQNYNDLSNDKGFQFEFTCECCNKSFTSEFVRSRSYKSRKGKEVAGNAAGFIGRLFGGVVESVGGKIDEAMDTINDNTDDAAYDREKHDAFLAAHAEALKNLSRCEECGRWVCSDCYSPREHLCYECSDEKKNREEEAAREEEERVICCPLCGEEVPAKSRFCGHCGKDMFAKKKCPKCGAENPQTMKFCGSCGTRLK